MSQTPIFVTIPKFDCMKSVERGAEAALVHMPGLVARHRAHAGPEHLARRQHFHAAPRGHVGAVREVRRAVLEGVPDDAAPAEVRDRDHQPVPARADGVVQVEPADAGLDDGVRAVLVDLEDAVHPARLTITEPFRRGAGPP